MPDFAHKLIAWQRAHGRHGLPWQCSGDAYATWVSEIMLQQTQVGAVIPYYARFMARFPDLAALAGADEDSVLQHWSGLGYYARARNLHRAARLVVERHGGVFPSDIDAILALPGIGRSTACAIAAFAFGQRRAILDGNVKRVLTRVFGIDGWPDQPAVQKQLWALAETLLPERDIEAYTQGLMDLGATLCTRSKPRCGDCPLHADCIALQQARVHALPSPRPRKVLPHRQTTMLLLLDGNDILLEKRPPNGIWGGLWSLPELDPGDDAILRASHLGAAVEALPPLPAFDHTFTHFRLTITPQPLRVLKRLPQAAEGRRLWLDLEAAREAALPTPVRSLLLRLASIHPYPTE
jgi:A/G-specific adenine glycosylase